MRECDQLRSRLFLILWSLSYFLNYAEDWKQPVYTFFLFLVCVFCFWARNLRWAWGLFLVSSTPWLLLKFPILANHSIFTLFVNLWISLIFLFRRGELRESFFRSLLYSLAVVYFCAALHKANVDFLFQPQSCAYNFLARMNRAYFGGDLPEAILSWKLLPSVIVIVEALMATFLFTRRFFYLGFLLSIFFHIQLAALEFVDFSMTALSIFLPALTLFESKEAKISRPLMKVLPYFVGALCVSAILAFFVRERGTGSWTYNLQAGVWVAFAVYFLIIGVPFTFRAGKRSVKVASQPMVYAFPTLVLLFGLSNYVGLSTAGTFSMFSNLKTEGTEWNHIFMPRFLRVFTYQNQIYWIQKVDRNFRATNREHPRRNYGMPEIEFYRLLNTWRKQGRSPSFIQLKVGDRVLRSRDILGEKEFRLPKYSALEFKLLFFRRIQAEGEVNRCRW